MLSDNKIKGAKPAEKKFSLPDIAGLYIVVMPNGAKLWRFRYQFLGKRRELSLGKYPAITLKAAREKATEYRNYLDRGVDPYPYHNKKIINENDYTVAQAIDDFLAYKSREVTPDYLQDCRGRFNNHVIPRFGNRVLSSVTTEEYQDLIVGIDRAGLTHMATRIKGLMDNVYRHALLDKKVATNPILPLTGLIKRKRAKHYPRITDPRRFGQLLAAIDGYQGSWQVKLALQFIPLVFTRQKEIRFMEWCEVDLDRNVWVIPEHKIKMRRMHIVPLVPQSIAIINEAATLGGMDGLVFKGTRRGRPLSENTISSAIHSLGFDSREMTGHGFRGTASTLLHERGYPTEHVDMQLAHWSGKDDRVYNHATYLSFREDMLRDWADYLDELKMLYG